MAVSPVGNAVYVNQATPAATQIQKQENQRLDFQNAIAGTLNQDEKDKIQKTKPVEENHKINPDREHQKHEKEDEEQEEQNLKQQQKKKPRTHEVQDEPEPNRVQHIDIRA
ncbi:MAG: hypothetical protein OIF32_01695 [Campylobacterales bacterium]|nr:hypothetical protein [Campylobacterales bacterium]